MNINITNHLKCEACGADITYPEFLQNKDLGYQVCKSFDCRRVVGQKSSMPPALYRLQLQRLKESQQHKSEQELARRKYIEEAEQRELQQNIQILHQFLKLNSQIDVSEVHVMSLPTGLKRLVSLSETRIENYRSHLISIITQAFESMENPELEIEQHQDIRDKLELLETRFNDKPELQRVSDKFCTLCKGGCCTAGKDNAYLSVIGIRRILQNQPELSQETLLDLYLSHLKDETIDGACINQTATGCCLPKALRSDICNSFYCESIKQFHNVYDDKTLPAKYLLIQRTGTCWNWQNIDVNNEVQNVVFIDDDQATDMTYLHSPLEKVE